MTDKESNKPQTPAQKVIGFFADELGIDKDRINMTSRLRQDLGLNDEDAANLVELYALTFDVNIDEFRMNDYFGTDGDMPEILAWVMWLFGNARPLKTLTIADLVRAFDKGKLP